MTTYYHNPRCSKSRQGLKILEAQGIDFQIKDYLTDGLSLKEIESLIKMLGNPIDSGLIRVKESTFKELELKGQHLSPKEWAKILNKHPILLERPILVHENKAVIGRPPENILKIL